MQTRRLSLLCLTAILLGVNLQSCDTVQQMIQGTPTSTPTNTITPSRTPTASLTSTPTKTLTPTVTPDLAATQKYEEFYSSIQKFHADGYIPSTNGTSYSLDNYYHILPSSSYFEGIIFDVARPANFVMQSIVNIDGKGASSDNAGCGYLFHALGPFVRSILYFGTDGRIYYLSGYPISVRTRRFVDPSLASKPDGVKLTLIVYKDKAIFLVNDEVYFTLGSNDGVVSRKSGGVGPAVVSGSKNGVSCNFREFMLWTIDE